MNVSTGQTLAQKQESLFSEFLSQLRDEQQRAVVEPFEAADTSKFAETMVSSSERLSNLLEGDSGLNQALQSLVDKFSPIRPMSMSSSGNLSVVGANQDPETHLQDKLIAAIVLRLARTHYPRTTASLPTPERFLEDNNIFLN